MKVGVRQGVTSCVTTQFRRGGVFLNMLLVLCITFLSFQGINAQDIPDKPVPPRLVNDLAGILSSSEVNALERKLVAFDDTTSNQIAIVIVNDLSGYEKADYAVLLGEKWGIGRNDLDNGVLILVKPKTPESRGEAFIATGYGLEGAIPDLACADIVDNEMIPSFRNGNYYEGIDRATNVLMSLASGEYNYDQYSGKGRGDAAKAIPAGFFIIIVIIIIALLNSGRSNHNNISRFSMIFLIKEIISIGIVISLLALSCKNPSNNEVFTLSVYHFQPSCDCTKFSI